MSAAFVAKQKELEALAKQIQEIGAEMQSLHASHQQLVGQMHENDMALEELNLLEDDADVFKLIGPALVKQEKGDAVDTVKKRLDFIKSKMAQLESEINGKKEVVEKKKTQAYSMQAELQQAQQQMMQQMQAQQQQQQQQLAAQAQAQTQQAPTPQKGQ